MQITLLAVGQKPPKWVVEGFQDYARRLPPECALRLQEIPVGRRTKRMPVSRAVHEEGERMLAALRPGSLVIALDEHGSRWTSADLASQLKSWLSGGRDVALLIGGPDGLAEQCRARAESAWSLSPMTLPHNLARIMVAEQLYRAWTILNKHPYHRR